MFLLTLNWRKNLIWIQRNLLTTFRPNRILQVVGPFGKKLQISVKSTDFEPITNGKKIPTIVAIIIVFLS